MPSNIDTLISSGDENKIRENVINRLISTKKHRFCVSVSIHLNWRGNKESNPDQRFWRPLFYH